MQPVKDVRKSRPRRYGQPSSSLKPEDMEDTFRFAVPAELINSVDQKIGGRNGGPGGDNSERDITTTCGYEEVDAMRCKKEATSSSSSSDTTVELSKDDRVAPEFTLDECALLAYFQTHNAELARIWDEAFQDTHSVFVAIHVEAFGSGKERGSATTFTELGFAYRSGAGQSTYRHYRVAKYRDMMYGCGQNTRRNKDILGAKDAPTVPRTACPAGEFSFGTTQIVQDQEDFLHILDDLSTTLSANYNRVIFVGYTNTNRTLTLLHSVLGWTSPVSIGAFVLDLDKPSYAQHVCVASSQWQDLQGALQMEGLEYGNGCATYHNTGDAAEAVLRLAYVIGPRAAEDKVTPVVSRARDEWAEIARREAEEALQDILGWLNALELDVDDGSVAARASRASASMSGASSDQHRSLESDICLDAGCEPILECW